MKFKVNRTSSYIEKNPPCDGAILEKVIKESYYKKYIWSIEVNTLEELIQLANKTDCPIIVFKCEENDEPEIEIYDDYRE